MDWSVASKQIETILKEVKKDRAIDEELEQIRNNKMSHQTK